MLGSDQADEHHYVQQIKFAYCHDGQRHWQIYVVGLDRHSAIALRQRWSRGQVEARLANLRPRLIRTEVCVSAHHLSRKLLSQGHDSRLMGEIRESVFEGIEKRLSQCGSRR